MFRGGEVGGSSERICVEAGNRQFFTSFHVITIVIMARTTDMKSIIRIANCLAAMMPRRVAFAFFIMTILTAWGNDGVYYTSGNHLVPLQETDISVRKEVLTISLMDNGYARVDVQYEFWNPGAAKRVTMGFEADPPYNDDYRFHPSGKHPNINSFTVEMNGRRLVYRNAACVMDGNSDRPLSLPLHFVDTSKKYFVWDNNALFETGVDTDEYGNPANYDVGIDFTYVYYFDANFEPGLNRVHHTYVYRMSIVAGIPYMVNYKLTPAARWAGGKIDDFTLVIRADNTAKHFLVGDSVFGNGKFTVSEGMGKTRRKWHYSDRCTEVTLRNGAVTLHRTGFRPTSEMYIAAVGIDDIYDSRDNSMLVGGTYDRSFNFLSWPFYERGNIKPADKAFRQRVIRNLPYASRGHVFKDKRLREYFERLWWYMPDPTYKDNTDDFTPADWECVNYKEK